MYTPAVLVQSLRTVYVYIYSQTCLKRPLKGPKKCGLITQVNYTEKCTFVGSKRAVSTQVVLRTDLIVLEKEI